MAWLKRSLLVTPVAVLFLMGCATETPKIAEPNPSWIAETERQAIDDGVTSATAHAALDTFIPNAHVVELDKKQPETTITFAAYRRNVVTAGRIQKGANILAQYAYPLGFAQQETGVPASVIVALWGIESSFGSNMGNYETINSLATLAYEGRRAAFFKTELFAALHILDQEHLPPQALHGSWAGAMGQCQFMPSTYLKYAVDGDDDGRRDIWNDPSDVIASIAHYLSSVGWQRNVEWGHEIDSATADQFPQGTVLQPDGTDGPSFVTTENVRALMRWNHSTYFALSVGLLADQIAATRPEPQIVPIEQ